jgi:signal peptidase I
MGDASKPRRGGFTTLSFLLLGIVLLFTIVPFGPGIRTYRQPSGSMQPTLYPGDMLVVTKWTYGYGRYSFAPFPLPMENGRLLGRAPQRGELAVFRPSPEPDRDFIKRVVGLPGDRIQMIDGVLHINGEAVAREPVGEVSFDDGSGQIVRGQGYRETLPGGASYVILDRTDDSEIDNTPVYQVPEGHYFMMGDDRDNSADSRVPSMMGNVPIENFIGPVSWIIPASGAERIQ